MAVLVVHLAVVLVETERSLQLLEVLAVLTVLDTVLVVQAVKDLLQLVTQVLQVGCIFLGKHQDTSRTA